ncbi:hypothetical protein [Bacillus atrophaeus]|uniref:hypothetical protein n=1 Tax=Bacillus atrophaeus TaxID=1452 RepID=UPI00227F0256|nr:hypothetical protein [Bacillus atrophaeus]MCY8958144.1 hypothetical protein [Bacillus atrophaeus]MCY8963717.1 hypothetical protein [Bacillus atrophaeus]MCY9161220.1 hypothetical protein [Bacillus atrophaeus]MCY9440263.1 hypothetical protein [Bacillus atrophaeus]MEC0648543.1 hypothetical protein [Bacillus atrophaeus]
MFNKTTVRRKLAELNIVELIKFIRVEFPANGQQVAASQYKKIEVLKLLSHNDLTVAIARMSRINNVYDIGKSVSMISAVISSIILIFKSTFGEGLSTSLLVGILVHPC